MQIHKLDDIKVVWIKEYWEAHTLLTGPNDTTTRYLKKEAKIASGRGGTGLLENPKGSNIFQGLIIPGLGASWMNLTENFKNKMDNKKQYHNLNTHKINNLSCK